MFYKQILRGAIAPKSLDSSVLTKACPIVVSKNDDDPPMWLYTKRTAMALNKAAEFPAVFDSIRDYFRSSRDEINNREWQVSEVDVLLGDEEVSNYVSIADLINPFHNDTN